MASARKTFARDKTDGWVKPSILVGVVIVGFGLMIVYTPVSWITLYAYRVWFLALFVPLVLVTGITAVRRHLSIEVRARREQPPKQYLVTRTSLGAALIVGLFWVASAMGILPAYQRLAAACTSAPYANMDVFCPCLMRVVADNPVPASDIEGLGTYFSSHNLDVFTSRNPSLKDDINACGQR